LQHRRHNQAFQSHSLRGSAAGSTEHFVRVRRTVPSVKPACVANETFPFHDAARFGKRPTSSGAAEFGELVGLTARTLYDWKRRFEREGPAGLQDRPRRMACNRPLSASYLRGVRQEPHLQRHLLLAVLATACSGQADCPLVFPGASWTRATDPALLGWSVAGLEQVHSYAREVHSKCYLIVDHGVLVDVYGDPSEKLVVQSIRKSFLNALIGMELSAGRFDLDSTLEQLAIDDVPPLTPAERSATLAHLLASKSGVYHAAASSPDFMRAYLPERGSHAPGSYWYYNNWDFNALGTIFERQTGESIFASFERRIAGPLRMEDFSPADCYYQREPASIHPAYHFAISPRDMARFGLLYLARGAWNGVSILNPQWIDDSTRAYSGNKNGGYGYLWWVDPASGDYSARGGSAQLILVSPSRQLVIVHVVDRHDTSAPGWDEVFELLDRIEKSRG
jgi:hypothetical protein